MDLFKEEKERWLLKARETARELLKDRDSIIIDDVTELCPRPKYLHRNLTGQVFDDSFTAVGFARARHPAAKGRWIREWTLRGTN